MVQSFITFAAVKALRPATVIMVHLFFGVLMVLSVLFYQERTLYADTACQLYDIICNGTITFTSERYSAAIPKIPALAVMYMGGGLKATLITYSLSMILLFYGMALAAIYRYKNVAAGLACALVLVLGIRGGFYHTVNENHMAAVICCLFWAWLNADRRTAGWQLWTDRITGPALVTFAFFAHPVSALVILFINGWYFLEKKSWKEALPWITIVTTILLGLGKFVFTSSESYEGHFLQQVGAVDQLSGAWSDLPVMHLFLFKFSATYIYPTLLWLLAAVLLMVRKRWLRAGYLLLTGFGFMMFMSMAFWEPDSYTMLEGRLVLPTVLGALPFVHEWFRKDKPLQVRWQWLGMLLAVFILVQGTRMISKGSRFYTQRLSYLQTITETVRAEGHHRVWMDVDHLEGDRIGINWAVPFETLMLSALESPDSAVMLTIYPGEFLPDPEQRVGDMLFVPDFLSIKFESELYPEYFRLPDGDYVEWTENIPYREP